jgi:hypothetical protein
MKKVGFFRTMSNEWKTRKVKELQEIEGDGNRMEGNRGRYLTVLFSIFYLEPKKEGKG